MAKPENEQQQIARIIAKAFLVGDCDDVTCDHRIDELGGADQGGLAIVADAIIALRDQASTKATGEWVTVPREPSRKLIEDLASEWGYDIEETCESYQDFLDVVARHGFGSSDPAAYTHPATNEEAQCGLNDTWPGDKYPNQTPCQTCGGTKRIAVIAGTTTPEQTRDCPTCVGWPITGIAAAPTPPDRETGEPVAWSEDDLAAVIDDSLGPDWTSRDAAKAVMDFLKPNRKPDAVEALAAAIYNTNPCGDQETDLDGRPTGPGYLIRWDQMDEYNAKEAAKIREVARLIYEGRLADFLAPPANHIGDANEMVANTAKAGLTEALAEIERLESELEMAREDYGNAESEAKGAALDVSCLQRVQAYIAEFKPRCYDTDGGRARRTAFQEIEDLIAQAGAIDSSGEG
ncbi:hypothetical protein PMI01_00951 [Caulobacter sp. AP07]|uniref:hypothetical protein n=1 Tax=Caulobacter sp. AP07 TaxID=1144304 RepID=UPI0002721AD4|nr:hypothetical protein [Caulobacter sp. AP07]EJL36576.1 hypothetical protein PMI01_00951 [Caulobacter sp. AP07]